MNATVNFRLKNPPHPGSFVRTEIIEALRAFRDGCSGGPWHHARSTFELSQ